MVLSSVLSLELIAFHCQTGISLGMPRSLAVYPCGVHPEMPPNHLAILTRGLSLTFVHGGMVPRRFFTGDA